MSEDSTTPDLAELFRGGLDAANRRDLDAVLALFAPGATWEVMLLDRKLADATAIRGFLEDWIDTFKDWGVVVEEVLTVGDAVTLGVIRQTGQARGGSGIVGATVAIVALWLDGQILRAINFTDIGDARTAAEHLAGA